ncbi:hypothetical protein SARC_09619, partial [Sphaeroforma arctica JP610]
SLSAKPKLKLKASSDLIKSVNTAPKAAAPTKSIPSVPEDDLRELELSDDESEHTHSEGEEGSESASHSTTPPTAHTNYDDLDSDEEEREREEIMRSLDATLVSESEHGPSEPVAPRFKSVHNLSVSGDDRSTHSLEETSGSPKAKRKRKPKSTLGWQGFASSQQDMRNISDPGYGRQDSDCVVRTSLLLAKSQLRQLSSERLKEIHSGLTENIAEMWKAFHAQEELNFYLQSKNKAHQETMAKLLEMMNDNTQELASQALAREESLRQAELDKLESLKIENENSEIASGVDEDIYEAMDEAHQSPSCDETDELTSSDVPADHGVCPNEADLPEISVEAGQDEEPELTSDDDVESEEEIEPAQQQGFLARMFSGQP